MKTITLNLTDGEEWALRWALELARGVAKSRVNNTAIGGHAYYRWADAYSNTGGLAAKMREDEFRAIGLCHVCRGDGSYADHNDARISCSRCEGTGKYNPCV